MHFNMKVFLVCALSIAAVVVVTPVVGTCPPEGYDSVPDFDLDAYIDGPWFVQQQIPVSYQPADSLFCVRAEYSRLDNDRILVQNSDATTTASEFFALNAVIPDQSDPSKLAVGPSFLPTGLYGPYWVVAAGPFSPSDPEWEGKYEWAIITGGAPDAQGENGTCIFDGFVNGNGFWLFTREQEAAPEVVAELRSIAAGLGLDVSQLLVVDQSPETCEGGGCLPQSAECATDSDCCSGTCSRPGGFFSFFLPLTCTGAVDPSN